MRRSRRVAATALGLTVACRLLGGAAEAAAPPDADTRQRALESAGWGAFEQGLLGLAIETLEQSLALAESIGGDDRLGRTHGLLGIALQEVGLHERALEHYRLSRLAYARSGNAVGQVSSWLNAGTAQGEWLARFDDAIRSFSSAIALAHERDDVPAELTGLIHLNLAEALTDSGQPDAALAHVAASRRLFVDAGHDAYLSASWSLASKVARARDRPAEATAAARRAVSHAATSRELEAQRVAQFRLGEALGAMGRDHEAERSFEASARFLERRRKAIGAEELQVSFLRDKTETYEAWISQLHRLHRSEPDAGWDEKALGASESWRARSFLDHLPDGGTRRAAVEPLNGSAVAALLDDDQTLLEYFFGRDRAYLFVLRGGALRFIDLGQAAPLRDQLALWAWDLRDEGRSPERGHRAAKTLERLVPAQPEALTATRLLIVPDGPLHRLSFAGLMAAAGIDPPPISLAPSVSVLRSFEGAAAHDPSASSVLAVGVPDPRPDVARLEPLDRAVAEATTAWKHGTQRRAHDLLVGVVTENALREALAHPHAVLHLAAHAVTDTADAGRGGFLLNRAPGSEATALDVDGVLTVREIAALQIGADLAVLSGCTTAGNEVAPGEGMLGLGRSFLRAGVPVLLVTLWNVPDGTAYAVSRRFYDGLARGLSAEVALARAQRALAEDPDAYAFVVVGRGGTSIRGLHVPFLRRRTGMALIVAGAIVFVVTQLAARSRRRRATGTST